ncbi:MAG: hypothetical protein ACYDC2_02955 [Solirubrobacteraceae bacterium]
MNTRVVRRRMSIALVIAVPIVSLALWAAHGASAAAPAKKHAHRPTAPPSYAKAYGRVSARAVLNGENVLTAVGQNGRSEEVYPLYRVQAYDPKAGSPAGTYCFRATDARPGEGSVVVASVTGKPTTAAYADWVIGATDCAPGQFEIQTGEYVVQGTAVVPQPSNAIAFSFVVP